MVENFRPEKQIDLQLFDESSVPEVQGFLENMKVEFSDLLILAKAVSTYPNELYSRYHNFFSFKKDNSVEYLRSLIQVDVAKLNESTLGSLEKEKLQKKITIAEVFINFVKKYGWEQAFNAVSLLENTLKH